MKTFFTTVVSFVVLTFFGCAMAQGGPVFKDARHQDQQLLALLKSRDYDELDSLLDRLVKRYDKDSQFEGTVDIAFDAFFRAGPELEPLLTEWIARRPRSYVAYLARGVHYAKVGWSTRGTRYFHETTKQQLDGMAFYFEKALKDLDQAYALNNRLVHALCYKMDILMNFAARDQIRALRDRALEIDPLSLKARWYYITTILPRWGGSIPEVSREIEAARPHYGKKPALRVLEGRIPAEYGDQAMFSGNLVKAVEWYSTALTYGSHWFYGNQRGDAYSRLNQYDLAAKDLDTAIELRPNYPRAQYLRGFGRYASGKLNEAIVDLTRAVEANPYDHKAWDIRGDAYFRLGKADLALADFERAVALAPNNAEYLADRERANAAKPSRR